MPIVGSREQPAGEHRFVREVVTYVMWVSFLELVIPRMAGDAALRRCSWQPRLPPPTVTLV